MSENDKYPESSGRRRFVKGVVGASSLATVGAAGAAGVGLATQPSGAGGGTTIFWGVENTSGPAPRGMPMIPVRVDDDGSLRGYYPEVSEETVQGRTVLVAEEELGGATYSANWFQYCGVQSYAGLSPAYEGDNYFRYASGSSYDWQNEEVEAGAQANVSDFEDYEEWGNGIGRSGLGKPAKVTWRSQDTEDTIPVLLIRSKRIERMAGSLDGEAGQWLEAASEAGFIAILDKCTHFCCVPSFKGTEQSAKFGAEDEIYCPCHQSVYDPFSLVKKSFVAYPRPEEG